MNKPARFQWDKAKAASNAQKHLVRFETATLVFRDASRVEVIDNRRNYGEVRFVVLGSVQGVVLYVAYTMRANNTARIISARLALTKEGDAYHGKKGALQKHKARFT